MGLSLYLGSIKDFNVASIWLHCRVLQKKIRHLSLQVVNAVTIYRAVFRDVTPCGLVKIYRCFGKRAVSILRLKNGAALLPKQKQIFTRPHGVTSPHISMVHGNWKQDHNILSDGT